MENNKFLSLEGLQTLVNQIYQVFATKSWVSSTYATIKDLNDVRNSASSVDATKYATKSELNDKANKTHTHTAADITNLELASVPDIVCFLPENESEFSQSLENQPANTTITYVIGQGAHVVNETSLSFMTTHSLGGEQTYHELLAHNELTIDPTTTFLVIRISKIKPSQTSQEVMLVNSIQQYLDPYAIMPDMAL